MSCIAISSSARSARAWCGSCRYGSARTLFMFGSGSCGLTAFETASSSVRPLSLPRSYFCCIASPLKGNSTRCRGSKSISIVPRSRRVATLASTPAKSYSTRRPAAPQQLEASIDSLSDASDSSSALRSSRTCSCASCSSGVFLPRSTRPPPAFSACSDALRCTSCVVTAS
eukprot:2068802-Prymnesium_polylepis.1